ncbi:MAG: ABC transporter substrate-binding protein [Rubrivivax sp.]|nr:ABC transporter substrate-binding protein [Rubrivivax sp.]
MVAVLHSQSLPPPEALARDPLRPRLRELGWEEGKTVAFESAYAGGREGRLQELAAALVAKKVDVIVTAGGDATRAAKLATDTIPIVAIGPNIVAMGYAGSLARPGGNVTGPSFDAGPALPAKRLELLKLALPAVKRIAYLRNSGQSSAATELAVAAARTHDLALATLVIDGPADFEAAFAELVRQRPDAIWVADSPANIAHRSRIIEFAARERLPALYGNPQFADSGGLMSYGVNLFERIRTAAQYVDKILRGAKPGELPIEQATTLELVINLKTARALGLAVPQALLLSADRVIE